MIPGVIVRGTPDFIVLISSIVAVDYETFIRRGWRTASPATSAASSLETAVSACDEA